METMQSQAIGDQSVGIDVAADTLQARIGLSTTDRQLHYSRSQGFPNTEAGYRQLVEWVRSKPVDIAECWFVMEATGVYYEQLAYWLHQAGRKVCVLVASRAYHWAQSLPIKSKTDRIDARLLARYGLERRPRRWQPGSQRLREIKLLLREREQLQAQRTQLKNRLHAARQPVACGGWRSISNRLTPISPRSTDSWRSCGSPIRPCPSRSGVLAKLPD